MTVDAVSEGLPSGGGRVVAGFAPVSLHESASERWIRTAVFVDFDNVYVGLRKLDPVAAEKFATEPANWLAGLASAADVDGAFQRRFLVCNCYLNPSVYAQYRPFFTRAGFRVIDCPSLTQQGKSSADINVVLDVVDALGSSTRYDEFILLSGDADFTPVAMRLRAQDRRVTVVVAGPAAAAYRSVADVVVEPDAFAQVAMSPARDRLTMKSVLSTLQEPLEVETALEAGDEVASTGRDEAPASKPAEAEDVYAVRAVVEILESADGPVPGPRLAHAARTALPALQESHWMGYKSFSEWLTHRVPIAGQTVDGTWHHVWDNRRFSEADVSKPAGLIAKVSAVTGAPALEAELYAALILALADDVNSHPFDRTETSKRVRDACQTAGYAIGRAAVNFVIQGLAFAGFRLTAPVHAGELASAWADNVLGLCRGARMDLDPATTSEIRDWVGGGLASDT